MITPFSCKQLHTLPCGWNVTAIDWHDVEVTELEEIKYPQNKDPKNWLFVLRLSASLVYIFR